MEAEVSANKQTGGKSREDIEILPTFVPFVILTETHLKSYHLEKSLGIRKLKLPQCNKYCLCLHSIIDCLMLQLAKKDTPTIKQVLFYFW